jgi:hypothetical protein
MPWPVWPPLGQRNVTENMQWQSEPASWLLRESSAIRGRGQHLSPLLRKRAFYNAGNHPLRTSQENSLGGTWSGHGNFQAHRVAPTAIQGMQLHAWDLSDGRTILSLLILSTNSRSLVLKLDAVRLLVSRLIAAPANLQVEKR